MRKNQSKYLLLSLIGFFTILSLLITLHNDVTAAPAAPTEVTLSQPDGAEFKAVAWGDEWLHGMETTEGYTIQQDPESNYWLYLLPPSADRQAPKLDNDLKLVVGRDDPSGLEKHIRPKIDFLPANTQIGAPSLESRRASQQFHQVGTQKILVLLVEFENWSGSTSASLWHETIFGQVNSLRHYYDEVSFGQLDLIPAEESYGTINDGVVGWIKLEDYYHPYDLGNEQYSGTEYSQEIAHRALQAANDTVNFASFDSDNNGYISTDELHILMIVAGFEGAYGVSCGPYIWAHHATLQGYFPVLVLDNKRLALAEGEGGYMQLGEIHCDQENTPGHPATIGIIAHELGHDLRLPDLYEISNSYTQQSTAGIGNWGVMGTGMWNRSNPTSPFYGDSPAHPTAWSRWYLGWLTPYQITQSSLDIPLTTVESSQVVFQLRDNPNGVDWSWLQKSGVGDYFLVENRQKIGYDSGLPGAGLLIWHIDESVTYSNSANSDPSHRLVDLVQADGLYQLNTPGDNRGDSGDPYPGSTANTIFNLQSNPSSTLYQGIPSGVSINDISADNLPITAHFFVQSFEDVLPVDWYWGSVEALIASKITLGIDENHYYPSGGTTRAQMAVLLGRAIYGTVDPPETDDEIGLIFDDVNADHGAAGWIEQLYRDGLTQGCSTEPRLFCPDQELGRDQLAVFLIRFLNQGELILPDPEGTFKDVNQDYWAVREIEQLYREGYTLGCAVSPDLLYCPEKIVSRAEIAVFLERVFSLPKP